jgi:prepilin-type N-terminal cleavage/methylation domain-containing protein
MRNHRFRGRRLERGFTLLEMGIVLAVAAILAAVVLPDFIETQRNKMAERAAEGLGVVFDAARWFRLQEPGGIWPGEDSPGSNPESCTIGGPTPTPGAGNFKNALSSDVGRGYVASGWNDPTSTLYANPWGESLDPDLWRANPTSLCMLRINTSVPKVVENAFIAYVPQGKCNDITPTACDSIVPRTGYSRCCGFVPPPGVEAALQANCPSTSRFVVWDGAKLICYGKSTFP